MHVERYTRQPAGEWLLREFNTLEEDVPLAAIDCVLPLAAVYEGVTFEEEDTATSGE
ncbi:MAG: hypothetical protein BWY76_02992 [bacterium ADurb.Bin429]|nr:MAG: hypothetical protein BWY76_02992 [bacterium ADurb.Bin429]